MTALRHCEEPPQRFQNRTHTSPPPLLVRAQHEEDVQAFDVLVKAWHSEQEQGSPKSPKVTGPPFFPSFETLKPLNKEARPLSMLFARLDVEARHTFPDHHDAPAPAGAARSALWNL